MKRLSANISFMLLSILLLSSYCSRAQFPVGGGFHWGSFVAAPVWGQRNAAAPLLTGMQTGGYVKVEALNIIFKLGYNYYKPFKGSRPRSLQQQCSAALGCIFSPSQALMHRRSIVGFPLLICPIINGLGSITVEMGVQPTIVAPRMGAPYFFKGGYKPVFGHTEWAYIVGIAQDIALVGLHVRYMIFPQPGKWSFEPLNWRSHMLQVSLRIGICHIVDVKSIVRVSGVLNL